jgi:hypothetical protein
MGARQENVSSSMEKIVSTAYRLSTYARNYPREQPVIVGGGVITELIIATAREPHFPWLIGVPPIVVGASFLNHYRLESKANKKNEEQVINLENLFWKRVKKEDEEAGTTRKGAYNIKLVGGGPMFTYSMEEDQKSAMKLMKNAVAIIKSHPDATHNTDYGDEESRIIDSNVELLQNHHRVELSSISVEQDQNGNQQKVTRWINWSNVRSNEEKIYACEIRESQNNSLTIRAISLDEVSALQQSILNKLPYTS